MRRLIRRRKRLSAPGLMFAVGRLLGNFGKISTFFRSFGKTLKRFRVIFALVRDADLESQMRFPMPDSL